MILLLTHHFGVQQRLVTEEDFIRSKGADDAVSLEVARRAADNVTPHPHLPTVVRIVRVDFIFRVVETKVLPPTDPRKS